MAVKIVSLCPSTTELVFALGRGAWLVGVTDYCVRPRTGVRGLAKLGGTKSPAIRRIVDLNPDLVLLNQEENRREDAEILREAGLRLSVSFPRSVAETVTYIAELGCLLSAEQASDRISHKIQQARACAEERSRSRPPLSFAYLIWRKPYMAAGGDTYIDDVLRIAGGKNLVGSAQRYPELLPELLRSHHPDLVLLSSEPFPFQQKHARELAELSGLAEKCFRLVDGQLLSWHGARTARAIQYAEAVFERARRG